MSTTLQVDVNGQRRPALYVLFNSDTHTHHYHRDAAAADGGDWSAVCVYLMDDIIRHFVIAQKHCYRGDGALLEWIVPNYTSCKTNVSQHTTMHSSKPQCSFTLRLDPRVHA